VKKGEREAEPTKLLIQGGEILEGGERKERGGRGRRGRKGGERRGGVGWMMGMGEGGGWDRRKK